MTRLRAYPRLSDGATLARLREVQEQSARNPEALADLVEYDHPDAAPVATGAIIATRDEIRVLRGEVMRALDRWPSGTQVPPSQTGEFDRTLGRALHLYAAMLPADAAHSTTWNFLSAMVFPDLVWARFPNLHASRFLGNRQRNALRRVWRRQEVLGDLMLRSGPEALKEDELVGLLERSALARNRRLAREAAKYVIDLGARPGRDHWTREFYKRLTHMTGPLLLDVLVDEELESLVADVAVGGSWTADVPTEAKARGALVDTGNRATAAPDVVLSFHEAMLGLAAELSDFAQEEGECLLSLIEEEGGLWAAVRVAGSVSPGSAFQAALRANRLDLSVEALAISKDFRGLFGPELVELAEGRLASAER